MKKALLLAAGLALASLNAHAVIGMGDCKNVDWYQFGHRDGSESGRSSLGSYTEACARFGVKPDEAQYAKGLADGQWVKARRRF
jgi:hypothetical protein